MLTDGHQDFNCISPDKNVKMACQKRNEAVRWHTKIRIHMAHSSRCYKYFHAYKHTHFGKIELELENSLLIFFLIYFIINILPYLFYPLHIIYHSLEAANEALGKHLLFQTEHKFHISAL